MPVEDEDPLKSEFVGVFKKEASDDVIKYVYNSSNALNFYKKDIRYSHRIFLIISIFDNSTSAIKTLDFFWIL